MLACICEMLGSTRRTVFCDELLPRNRSGYRPPLAVPEIALMADAATSTARLGETAGIERMTEALLGRSTRCSNETTLIVAVSLRLIRMAYIALNETGKSARGRPKHLTSGSPLNLLSAKPWDA